MPTSDSYIFKPGDLNFLGSAWSAWPPHGTKRGLNIVREASLIVSEIFSNCLIQKGERPLHPDYGIAPELFEPFSNYAPEYFLYNITQELNKWIPDIEVLSVQFLNFDQLAKGEQDNQLKVEVRFIPRRGASQSTLTFGYYRYDGTPWTGDDIEEFLRGVTLNGEPFTKF